jgi:hypothetical protein
VHQILHVTRIFQDLLMARRTMVSSGTTVLISTDASSGRKMRGKRRMRGGPGAGGGPGTGEGPGAGGGPGTGEGPGASGGYWPGA